MGAPRFPKHPDYYSYLLDLAARQPEPPRDIDGGKLRSWVLRNSATWILVVVGLIFLACSVGMFIAFRENKEGWKGDLLCAFMAGFALFMLAGPFRYLRYLSFALKRGKIAAARVQTAEELAPNPRRAPATFDSLQNGLARGRRVVAGPRGDFIEDYLIDDPWARDVKPGFEQRVLVHPDKNQVLLDLPPAGWKSGPGEAA